MIKFYSKNMSDRGFPIKKTEIDANIGILVDHNGKLFTLSEDNYGRLTLMSHDQTLLIRPEASNRIVVKTED